MSIGLDDILITKLAQAISGQILKQLSANSAPAVQPVLLTVSEAAAYLGRSQQSVQHLVFERALPTVRVGRRIHLHKKDLDAWIEANKF
jgi:excisionase family DNA binding protein